MYGLAGGFGIGLPPILHFGNDEQKARIVGPCLRGEKRICLAITEVSSPGTLDWLTQILMTLVRCSRVEDPTLRLSPRLLSRPLTESITS